MFICWVDSIEVIQVKCGEESLPSMVSPTVLVVPRRTVVSSIFTIFSRHTSEYDCARECECVHCACHESVSVHSVRGQRVECVLRVSMKCVCEGCVGNRYVRGRQVCRL